MISLRRFSSVDLAIGNCPQIGDKGELMLRVVDFAAEQSGARSIFFCIFKQFERVKGRARGTTENADDQMRIVMNELLQGSRAVIGDLEKNRPAAAGDAGKGSHD